MARDYAALERKWDMWQQSQGLPKPPHDEWHYQTHEDLGAPVGQCAMCGKLYCRYMHHVTHPEWFGGDRVMVAGSECIQAMIRDADQARFDAGEKSMQAAVRREVQRVRREQREAEARERERLAAEARERERLQVEEARRKQRAEALARWEADAPLRAAAASAAAAEAERQRKQAEEARRRWEAEAPAREAAARAAREAAERAVREVARRQAEAEKREREKVAAWLYSKAEENAPPDMVLPNVGYRRTPKGWRRADGVFLYVYPSGRAKIVIDDKWSAAYPSAVVAATVVAGREAGVNV